MHRLPKDTVIRLQDVHVPEPSTQANSRFRLRPSISRNGGSSGRAVTQEVNTTRANGYLFFSFFSRFSFRFSSGLRWAFFCDSFFALSLLPLSPIFDSPCFGVRNVVDHIDATIVGRPEAKSNRGESREHPNSERPGKDASGKR
jgi:hypothetical protein